jgi:cob(I)alamin adenosyltransferase
MKIYTRTGDSGTTGLIGGTRISKSDPRLDCYGTIDELNAAIGLCAACTETPSLITLHRVQNELFIIGSHLATPPESPHAVTLPALDESSISRLEMEIDAADAQLPPLRQFILPGGSESAARLHLARTICRRAERLLVDFAGQRPIAPIILTYLNRLSDWLFVQARLANHLAGQPDIPWQKPT